MSSPPDDPLEPRSPRALVVMARAPVAGACKTRLCPPLTADEAAALYSAFLDDLARELPADAVGCDLWIAWTGDDDGGAGLRARFGPPFRLVRQRGDDLTARMEDVFERFCAAGYRAVVMRNSDSPHLPWSLAADAFDALEAAGAVVLGPDLDGGYYLIGANAPVGGLLPRAMSTASVFEETSAAAAAAGRPVVALEPFPDIDTPDDLAVFWLEFGGRADVHHWATWRMLEDGDIVARLEALP